jgi:membrane associated rhomboid family serine protease
VSAHEWRAARADYVPPAFLVAVLAIAWIAHLPTGDMTSWGVSAAALAQGKSENILLHMLAHGSFFHLVMNSLALLEIGALLVARFGGFPNGWLRTLIVFGLAGLSSMIFFLSFHPEGRTPMIGASGAVYGLIGLLLGTRFLEEADLVRADQIAHAVVQFVRNNLFFLGLLVLGGLLAGIGGGVAWEAHAGGFLFGLCVGPWLVPQPSKGPN